MQPPPPLLPQIAHMISVNKKAIWQKLGFAHVAVGLTTYMFYKIPVSEEAKKASKTLNPWQASGH